MFFSYLLLEMMYQYILFQIFHKLYFFYFLRNCCYAGKKPQYSTFTLRKSLTKSHLTKVQAFFYKICEEFNNDSYLEKSEVTTIKEDKIFNISLTTYTIHCVSSNLMIFLHLVLNLNFLNIFQKMCFFGKTNFVILRWLRSKRQ